MSLEKTADYIIGSGVGTLYERLLEQIIPSDSTSQIQAESIGRAFIEQYEKPCKLNAGIRFNYSFEDLQRISEKYSGKSEKGLNNVLILALSICGLRIIDDNSLSLIKPFLGYEKHSRYLRVSGTIKNRRLTMRVVPNSWGDSDALISTRFTLQGRDVFLDDTKIGELSSLFTASSLKNLAYITKNVKDEYNLNLNPYQLCAQNCLFCSKGYRHMTKSLRQSLVNLNPEQILRYVEKKLPELNFDLLTEVIVLTGRYANCDKLLDYVASIITGVRKMSGGKFDPTKNTHQRVKISTHLLASKDDMLKAKNIGINRYIYPIEVFNDDLRRRYMTVDSYTDNKGGVPINSVFESLEEAISVFGINAVEPVIIIGLDSYEDTVRGIQRIKNLGVDILTYSIFRVYDYDQFEMYRMTFEEIMDVISIIESTFSSGYKQIIDFDDKLINKLYKKM